MLASDGWPDSDQDPPYEYPNFHDYEQLATIYDHIDSYDSYASGGSTGSAPDDGSGDGGCNSPPGRGCNKSDIGQRNAETGWGISVGRRGQHETFLRIDADGTRHVTHVRWVNEEHAH